MATYSSIDRIDYSQYTLPILKKYAKKWEAEFMNLYTSYGRVPYHHMRFHELLNEYDRIVYIDSDVIINKICPNIFETVPYDTVGLVFEDKGSRLKNRRAQIAHIKNIFGGNENWISGYFNAGMFIISRPHREIFTKINGKLWGIDFKVREGADQAHFSYQLAKQGHKYIDLGYRWNHMSMFSEPWNDSPSRFDSYIIHYAGGGRFSDKGKRSRAQLIKDDIIRICGEA